MRPRKLWRWPLNVVMARASPVKSRARCACHLVGGPMTKTNIACAQIDCALGDPKKNREKIVRTIHAAAERDAQLVVFPECALTGYAFNALDEAIPFAERVDGRSAQAIAEACRETKAHAIVGFIEADRGKFYNAAMLVGPQ